MVTFISTVISLAAILIGRVGVNSYFLSTD